MNTPISFQLPRKLRVFAFDPATGNRYINRRIRDMTITVPWELDPNPGIGPDGEYLQVVDYDPASGVFYEPINLDAPEVLHEDGLFPSEENPQFHQQMVYAVAMDTISTFEQALGRPVLWASRPYDPKNENQPSYVRKLRIYPHALREANAFYDPSKAALLFGYFSADASSGSAPPNTTVFTCLSHDIIVHETCHAILDGLHPRFKENSNPDMLALHEAFSDIVAMFQHFSHPQVLEDQIARTRGDLEKQSLLGALAHEFGQALGHGGALRDALGQFVDGEWQPREPDNTILDRLEGPHARGAVLVAAVFRAFLSIYKERVADLFRIASAGSGILREGEVDPDLVKRLAGEAAKSARHVLRMCIRAMDYVPPVDVDFGDYLRAIITADHDLFPEDDYGYRAAVVEAFTAWGIYPRDLPVITEKALIWPETREAADDLGIDAIISPLEADFGNLFSRSDEFFNWYMDSEIKSKVAREALRSTLQSILFQIRMRLIENTNTRLRQTMEAPEKGKPRTVDPQPFSYNEILQRNLLESELENDREVVFLARQLYSLLFWRIISLQHRNTDLMKVIGVDLSKDAPKTIRRSAITRLPTFQVHSVRMATRLGKRGQKESEYVVEIIQSRDGYFDPEIQALADAGDKENFKRVWREKYGDAKPHRDFRYRCGSTLLIDTKSYEIRRVIRTRNRVHENDGLERQRQYLHGTARHAPNAFDDPDPGRPARNAFADLHRHVERGKF